jgi:hypothetical protein
VIPADETLGEWRVVGRPLTPTAVIDPITGEIRTGSIRGDEPRS